MEEIWRPVKGYEGIYEVSNIGNVRSLDRYDATGRLKPGVNKSTRINPHTGYPTVHLNRDGEQKLREVHRLVAEAFIPNPESKEEVDHINTIKHDNRVENLRWATRSENALNPITRKQNSERQKGHGAGIPKPPEHIKALNEGYRRYVNEHGSTFGGRKHSEETKQKMSETLYRQYESGKREKMSGSNSPLARAVCQYTLDGEYVRTFPTTVEAARETKASESGIYCCCNNKGKTSGGYLWKYAEEVVQ